MRKQLAIVSLAVAFSLLAGVAPCRAADAAREFLVRIKGLPPDEAEAVLLLRSIGMQDGAILASLRDYPASEISMEAPAVPSLIGAVYIAASPAAALQGYSHAATGGSAQVPLQAPAAPSSMVATSLPTYLPTDGMAIGYNPYDFTATGEGIEPWYGRALADCVIVDLVQAQCPPGGGASYVVVESANPKFMPFLEAELALQARPEFDPATRIKPRIIRPTHLLKGHIDIGSPTTVATLRLEDAAGNVVSTVTASGDYELFWDAYTEAVSKLAKKICAPKPWTGTVTMTLTRESRDRNSAGQEIRASGSANLSCRLTGDETNATCTYSSHDVMTGSGGSLTFDKSAKDAATTVVVTLTDKELKLEIGSLKVTVTPSATAPAPPLGPYDQDLSVETYVVPAGPDRNRQAGTWNDPSPALAELGAKITVTWDLSRK
jgi:hypothetical protein